MTLKVLAVASEIFPLVKTGGLADVVGALPAALAEHGIETRTLVPGYPGVMSALEDPQVLADIDDLFGGPAKLLAGHTSGLALFVLDAPHLYDRPGNPYLGPDGRDWPDNADRFAALSYMAAEMATGAIPGFDPHLLHAHDRRAWRPSMSGVPPGGG